MQCRSKPRICMNQSRAKPAGISACQESHVQKAHNFSRCCNLYNIREMQCRSKPPICMNQYVLNLQVYQPAKKAMPKKLTSSAHAATFSTRIRFNSVHTAHSVVIRLLAFSPLLTRIRPWAAHSWPRVLPTPTPFTKDDAFNGGRVPPS